MPEIFLASDTHFGHKNIIKYEHKYRPFSTIEEHDEALVDNWNRTVSKRDSVWHLGDVIFDKSKLPLLGRLNGHIKLVMGNHDDYPTEAYLKYFARVYGAAKVAGYALTHIPISDTEKDRWKGNIHGHLHSVKLDDPWYTCVSMEQIGLRPIALNVIIERNQK